MFASILFALALTVTAAHAQTGTTNNPNATNPQAQSGQPGPTGQTGQTGPTEEYKAPSPASSNDQTQGTGTINSYSNGNAVNPNYDHSHGPDLGWLGLLGLVGLLGLRGRSEHRHTREDELRGGRPATV